MPKALPHSCTASSMLGEKKKATAWVVSRNSKLCHKNMYVNLVEEFDKETIVLFPQM